VNLHRFENFSNIWYNDFQQRGRCFCMSFNNLFEIFKERCVTVKGFVRTKKGRNLFLVACAVFVLLFLAPLFQGSVGAALISCVAAPLTVMIWRRYDRRHAIVPAVFFSIAMILCMFIYHTLSTAACLLVAIVCTLAVAIHPVFDFVFSIEDNMYAYLSAGGVCACIVVLASLFILLVSIAWWIFCLLLFLAVVAIFFTVVLSTAAYTATDAKRQARKKQRREENLDDDSYDFDTFAQDIGLKNETDPYAQQRTGYSKRRRRSEKDEPLFYDAD